MNKKLVSLMCVGMLTASLGGNLITSAQADVVKDPASNTQTIDNSIGTPTNTADVDVTGTVGFDNTDPNSPEPSNPDAWLNIQVPTSMAFYSTAASNYEKIDGEAGTIKNLSGRPVKVEVASFTGKNLTGVSALSLKAEGSNGKEINLKNFVSGELITLDGKDTTATPFVGEATSKLAIGGQVDKTVKGSHKSENKLEFKFTPLNPSGQPIS